MADAYYCPSFTSTISTKQQNEKTATARLLLDLDDAVISRK